MKAELVREVCGANTLVCCGHRLGFSADSEPAALILVPVTGEVICLLDPGKGRFRCP